MTAAQTGRLSRNDWSRFALGEPLQNVGEVLQVAGKLTLRREGSDCWRLSGSRVTLRDLLRDWSIRPMVFNCAVVNAPSSLVDDCR